MSRIKNAFHDELEARRCIEDGRCCQCGEDAETDSEAWKHGICPDCFNEANGALGVGA